MGDRLRAFPEDVMAELLHPPGFLGTAGNFLTDATWS
jgi:hypothetical protein